MSPEGEHASSIRWINGFVRFYQARIELLLEARDKRLELRSALATALDDRRLEVLSLRRIDWAADLDAIEVEAARRGL